MSISTVPTKPKKTISENQGPALHGPEFPVRSALIHSRINDIAIRTPKAVAIRFQGLHLTYAQLANEIKYRRRELVNHDIEAGSIVVVALEPSIEFIPYILAIMSIGGIYVPIDFTYPEIRLLNIVEEFKKILLITNVKQKSKALTIQRKSSSKIEILFPDIAPTEELNQVELTVPDGKQPLDLIDENFDSHIFFTSGTTGKPKGVISKHRNLIHYIDSAINRYRFEPSDIFIAAAKYTFSISLFELLIPLAAGACVKLLPRESVLNLDSLANELKSATVFHFGPALLKRLLPHIQNSQSNPSLYKQIRHASSGGDFVPLKVLQAMRQVFCNAEIYVIYGSSEINCMGCTYQAPHIFSEITKTCVGKPHQNVKIKILDDNGAQVPRGVAGNIYISSPGRVEGYLNLPVLTQEKFITHDDGTYYSIGDIGKIDEDSDLEILGRADFQVQIKGMRIELQELEFHLSSLPNISDVVVISSHIFEDKLNPSVTIEPSLIAYLVTNNTPPLDITQIQNHLKSNLPDYMIPSKYVVLECMPLNHNGKLDRSQLPAPIAENILRSKDIVQPKDEIELKLQEIIFDLTRHSNIGINENFFDVGGDSLAAVSYLTEVEKLFDKVIPIAWFYHHPFIADISQVIRDDAEIKITDEVVVLKHGDPIEPPLFCLYGVFLYRDLAYELNTDRSICSVYLESEIELLRTSGHPAENNNFISVPAIADLYLKCIKNYQSGGPYYLCGESFGGIIAMEVARRLISEGENVAFVGMLDSSSPSFRMKLSKTKRILIHFRLCATQGYPYIKSLVAKNIALLSEIRRSKHAQKDSRVDARAFATQRYTPEVFDEQIVLFRAKSRSDFELKDKSLGWSEVLKNLTVHSVKGDHLSMLKKGNVHELARKIEQYL